MEFLPYYVSSSKCYHHHKKNTKTDQLKTSVFGTYIRTKGEKFNGDNESVLEFRYLPPPDEYAQINMIRE